MYAPADQLVHPKPTTLIILTYDTVDESLPSIVKALDKISEDSDIVLDIDLDYFATMNPFKEMYSPTQLDILATLYKYVEELTPERSTARRAEQLGYLRKTLKSAVEGIQSKAEVGEKHAEGSDEDGR